MLAVDENYYMIQQCDVREHSVSAKLEPTMGVGSWWLTVVYGPQEDQVKLQFLQELRNIRNGIPEKWLVIGDFNLILQAQDKSNTNLIRRMMGEFRSVLDDLEMKELKLQGRRFTWSNDTTQTPTGSFVLPNGISCCRIALFKHCHHWFQIIVPFCWWETQTQKNIVASGLRSFGRECKVIRRWSNKPGNAMLHLLTRSSGYISSYSEWEQN